MKYFTLDFRLLMRMRKSAFVNVNMFVDFIFYLQHSFRMWTYIALHSFFAVIAKYLLAIYYHSLSLLNLPVEKYLLSR